MYFKINNLIQVLNQFEEIIIYGTGNYAHLIYPLLVKWGIKKKITCFTQTKKEEKDLIDGIPIVTLEELHVCKMKCVILIAVSNIYLVEIKEILLEYGYPNAVSLVDYCLTDGQSEKNFIQFKTFEEYCMQVSEWYAQAYIDSERQSIVFERLMERGKNGRKKMDLNLIVIICGHLSPRILKIAEALKKKSKDVIMLRYGGGRYLWCLERLEKINIHIKSCSCIEEMLYEMLQYSPLVYYVEPKWGDCLWIAVMLKNKWCFGKFVLSLYDVMNDGHIGIDENWLITEKYALEHADGIVWRWFSKECLERKGFLFQGKSIQFIDYCNHIRNYNGSNCKDSSVIKLCMGIGKSDGYIDERNYDTQYTDHARIGEILEKIGNRQDCSLDMYAVALSERNVKRCEEYQKKYKNFHFFIGTNYDDFLIRLREYDFGCELWIDGNEPPDNIIVGEYSGSNYRDCVRNTFLDFIEAGLPVITTLSSKFWDYLSAYDIVIRMTLDNLNIDYLKRNKKYYQDNVAIARKELDIDNHISELIRFFEEV